MNLRGIEKSRISWLDSVDKARVEWEAHVYVERVANTAESIMKVYRSPKEKAVSIAMAAHMYMIDCRNDTIARAKELLAIYWEAE